MTTRIPEGSIRAALVRRHQALRRGLALRQSVRAAAAAAAAIVIAVLLGAVLGIGIAGAWTRLVLLALALASCVAWGVRRFLAQATAFDPYLESVEQRFPDVRSWLRNAIDFAGPRDHAGTSDELAAAVTQETVRKLDGLPLESLAPPLAPGRPLGIMALALAVIVGAALLAPRAVERSWSTLWNPDAAAPPIALSVEPGSVKITPGASLAVYAKVSGTARAPRLLRAGEKPLPAVAEGHTGATRLWRFDLAQLTRAQDYRVRVASVESAPYHITLTGEPAPVSFEIEYRAPAYARMPVQHGSALRGDLSALRGTVARVEVTFDRDLARLEAAGAGIPASSWKALSARRWQGNILMSREGEYELHAIASSGEGRFRYRIQPLADAPPVIAVRTPAGDLDLPAGQQVALEALGQDDLGLSEMRLEFRKDAQAPWRELPLARFGDRPREAQVRARWDASALSLLPGETATFRFVLFDDNAIGPRGRAESPVFELRFPSIADLYQQIDHTQGTVQKTLEKVSDQAKELQKSLDKLERQQPRATEQASPAFERSEELKSSLEHQQDLAKQLDQAAQQLNESVSKAEERQAFNDELQRKLREMAQLMQQIQSKDFKDALDRMQKALENLDKKALENQLPEWKQQNQEMMKNLERTLELLKKLREEERLDSLAKRAEELKAHQDELNQQHAANEQKESKDSKDAKPSDKSAVDAKRAAEQQEQAAKDSEQLAKDIAELAKTLAQQAEQQKLDQTSQDVQQQAAQPQHEAAQSAQKKQSGNAKQSGQKASQSLQKASEQLQQMAQQSQEEQQGVDLAAVRRAAQDLVSLQRQSESSLDSGRPNDERANQQTDLSDGVARISDSLGVLAQRSPFLSPKLTESLGRAMNNLSQSGKDLGTGNRAHGEQIGREGSTALNQAILELRVSEASMCQQPGQGKGQKPGMSQRMSELGQQQSQLNQRSKGLAQRLSQQMRLSAGDQGELERLSQEQARLREQLEQIQKDDDARQKLLGRLDAAQRDMKDVEEALRQGNTGGDLEEKQTRILSRLLDANRSVNRRDFDPQRESRPGEDVAQRSAAEIPADLLRETDRLRLDLLKADTDRYPAQYRAFIEAYLKALNGPRR